MIAVDTSAIIAVLKREPDAERFETALMGAEVCVLSAVSLFEASLVVIGRAPPDAARALDALLQKYGIEIVPFGAELAAIARDAFVRFGKGRHPAGLNMGDCAAYALAKAHDLPLLFKGDDFSQTDVRPALA